MLGRGLLTIFMGQGLVDEVCGPFKVSTEVELLRVIGLDAQVGDAGILVEARTGVDVHEGPALGGVQDVGDAQSLQLGDVLSHRPGWEAVAENEGAAPEGGRGGRSEPLGKARSPSVPAVHGGSSCLVSRHFPSPQPYTVTGYRQLPQIDSWSHGHAVPSASLPHLLCRLSPLILQSPLRDFPSSFRGVCCYHRSYAVRMV